MTTITGLTTREAKRRIAQYGLNRVVPKIERPILLVFLSKFANPLTISLMVVSVVSFFLGQQVDSLIIILMALLSVILGFAQEHSATVSAKKLNKMVRVLVRVIRDGKEADIPLKYLVPGDLVELSSGKMVPADGEIVSDNTLHVSQAALTGESFPALKTTVLDGTEVKTVFDTPNLVFAGSDVLSGAGRMIVTKTGKNTEFGRLTHEVAKLKKETSYDKGVKGFTRMMAKLIFVLVLFILSVNYFLKGNLAESLLFALAVAVGITPEMLPMIMTINLSKGAQAMAKKKVIIKELSSIQNFGAMDVLCTDKTGTLTNNQVALIASYDCEGKESEGVFEVAYLNSYFQEGLDNVLDQAVLDHRRIKMDGYKKVAEIPYDFIRRTVSVIVHSVGKTELIAKGAPERMFQISTHYLKDGKITKLTAVNRKKLAEQYNHLSREGFRVLAVACKEVSGQNLYSPNEEQDLVFVGFVAFLDPPKASATEAIKRLAEQGIQLKVLSGDNELVTEHIAKELELPIKGILTSAEMESMSEPELELAVEKATLFTRLTPLQKEKVIQVLQRAKHIVGYLGDGINDAPALKASDVGISVNNATDIAKDTAEVILLEKDLRILANCVVEGRKTFANTTKYIKMGASSNFGNMFSMAGASVFLPFLPMLPSQILLNNFLYDLSQIAIPTDNVDADSLKSPRPWNLKFIKEFVLTIGPISSVFDFLTFGVMIKVFHASESLFHTGWFVESLLTQVLVIYIIRTKKIPFLESRPSKALVVTTLGIVSLGIILPYLSIGRYLGFAPLPPLFFLILTGMALLYLLLTQWVKNLFVKKFGYE